MRARALSCALGLRHSARVAPPSTTMVAPFTKPACAEHTKATTRPKSAGSPIVPPPSPPSCRIRSVAWGPGQTRLSVIPLLLGGEVGGRGLRPRPQAAARRVGQGEPGDGLDHRVRRDAAQPAPPCGPHVGQRARAPGAPTRAGWPRPRPGWRRRRARVRRPGGGPPALATTMSRPAEALHARRRPGGRGWRDRPRRPRRPGPPPPRPARACSASAQRLLVASAHHEPGPVLGERLGTGPAQAPRRGGDQRHLARDAEVHQLSSGPHR